VQLPKVAEFDCPDVVQRTHRNFDVEKRNGTPYRTRSYLLGGTTWKTGREEAGYPPVFLRRKVRKEHAVE